MIVSHMQPRTHMRLQAVTLIAALTLPSAALAQDTIGRCTLFPREQYLEHARRQLPVDARSADYLASIGPDIGLHADFDMVSMRASRWGRHSWLCPSRSRRCRSSSHRLATTSRWRIRTKATPDPFPIPPNAPIEGGVDGVGDRHVIVLQQGSCTLFELYKAVPNADGSWNAVSAAKFDLEGCIELRIDGSTSADAAGLPILPGLARFEGPNSGAIRHVLRFTVPATRNEYVWPARHEASFSDDPTLPPMGQRFRLKADVDISGFSKTNQVMLTALKTYGLILADNGSPWFITGAPHDYWDNDDLRELGRITGADFEAVDVTGP